MIDVLSAANTRGNAMKKRISLAVISILVTLFFLAVSIYQLVRAYGGLATGDTANAALIAGWTSFLLFIIGLISLLLIVRSDTANI
jgi:uncharacterized membrane protein YidH (DUF202 family)